MDIASLASVVYHKEGEPGGEEFKAGPLTLADKKAIYKLKSPIDRPLQIEGIGPPNSTVITKGRYAINNANRDFFEFDLEITTLFTSESRGAGYRYECQSSPLITGNLIIPSIIDDERWEAEIKISGDLNSWSSPPLDLTLDLPGNNDKFYHAERKGANDFTRFQENDFSSGNYNLTFKSGFIGAKNESKTVGNVYSTSITTRLIITLSKRDR